MPSSPQVITRFAPSPTGHLHIGGARTALFCWAFAQRARHSGQDGRFLIRIEDTDQARSSDESARGILEDLAWLGITWDEGPELALPGRTIGGDPRGVGPFFQARRIEHYNAYIRWLVENELAYPAFETSAELEAMRQAAVAKKETFRYDRSRAMAIPKPERLKRMESGEPHVIRLASPRQEIRVKDRVLGDVKYAAGELDDFVLRKADGFPTYHFAVVIDDELMGVTHVLRAQEHLNNTPRHVALQMALRRLDTGAPFRTPEYGHMPLIMNMDGSKMSKRDKAKVARMTLKKAMEKDAALTPDAAAARLALDAKLVSDFIAAENDRLDVAEAVARVFGVVLPEIEVADFRQNGYTPEAIINFIALLGWNPGMKTPDGKDLEKFDRAFVGEHFDVARIGKTSAKFDRVKLASFNGDFLVSLSDEEFLSRWRAWCAENEPASAAALQGPRALTLVRAIKPRAKTFRDALKAAAFAVTTDEELVFDRAAIEKHLLANDGAGLATVKTFAARLEALPGTEPAAVNAAIEALAAELGVGMGHVAQPIRVAVTGSGVSPGLGETIAVLGKASALRRIARCIEIAR